MSRSLYIKSIPSEITLEKLIIHFQSDKSGGGDVDSDASKLDGDKAVVVFEKQESLESVLQRKQEILGYNLEISGTPPKPVPKKRKKIPTRTTKENIQPANGKAYLGKVRTVIATGVFPDTTNDTIELFFGNKRRSCGGEIEKLERLKPDVVHITFVSAEVASSVLKQKKLELEGYLLQLKEKQPELVLFPDKKKLYVENIHPKTTKDSLMYYIEKISEVGVLEVQFGENNNALITLDEETDLQKIQENSRPLDGAVLNVTNPPFCNSILITGLSTNTTKQAIELYFEKFENDGGGKRYGDVIYQKDKGKAVVSFCDPDVVQTLCAKNHKLNESTLSFHQHYAFMETVAETTKIVKLPADVLDHVKKNYENKFRDLFGIEIPEIFDEHKEDLTFPNETKEDILIKIQKYMDTFIVKEIPFEKKLLDKSIEELKMKIETVKTPNCAIAMEEERLRLKLIGNEDDVNEIYEKLKNAVAELEHELNVSTEELTIPAYKLDLFLLHGVDEMLMHNFHVHVKIEPKKSKITIRGAKKEVSSAMKLASEKFGAITEANMDVNERQNHFLESGGLSMCNNDLKAKGLKGMVFFNEQNKAKLLVFDSTTVEDIHLQLSNSIFENQFPLDEDSFPLLNSNKWKEFHESVTANTSVVIYTGSSSSTKISLIGEKSEVEQTFEELQEFMRRNTIVKESVQLGEGNTGYLFRFCIKDIKEIEKKLEEHLVGIHLGDEGMVEIDGTKEGVRKAKVFLQEFVSKIAKDEICFDKLRIQNYLKSEAGKTSIAGIESEKKCFIQLTNDDSERSTTIPSTRSRTRPGKPTSKLLCSYETPEKISLKVFQADITLHNCDVIVNAANVDLKHVGGVAKSIVDVGGEEIQDECDAYIKVEGKLYEGEHFSGSPGRLPCKRLIHAVGPRWNDFPPEKARKLLQVTCLRVLEESISKNYQSIALPAIGSGIYGIPKQICADVMIEAAELFSNEHRDCSLKEIHFVNNDDASGQVFVKKFQEKFGGRSSHYDATTPRRKVQPSESRPRPKGRKGEKRDVIEELPKQKPGDVTITNTDLKISVIVGDLSTHKADVLVNSTGQNLQLDSNPCGKALSNEAGPVLQAECNKLGQLQVGQVAATQGGNLLCDEVYHVACIQWNEGQGEKVLQSIIKNCLEKCNSNEKKSIAFPAIGTGTLGFPHDAAAKVFFEETREFAKKTPNCSIKEVSFVVYNQDSKSIEAFNNELKKQAECEEAGADTTVPNVSHRRRRTNQGTKSIDTKVSMNEGEDKQNIMCIQVGDDKEVEIVKGDITKETSDVIAHLTNPGLSLGGGVGMALASAGGESIKRECQEKGTSPRITSTVLTTAGQLNANYVAHMIASNDPNPSEIEKCINNCLKTVTKQGCESISFPAIGTGQLKHDPETAATTILTSIIRFLQSSSGPLKTVRIVLKDDNLVATFLASVKQLKQEEESGMWKKLVNFFWKTESAAINVKDKPPLNTEKLFLVIYAKDEATVNLAKKSIQKIAETPKTKQKIEDENIGKLSRQQITAIKHFCEMNEMKVTIETELNRIVVIGHSEDISKALTEIFPILKKVGEAEKEKETANLRDDLAEIVSQGVQWFWEDPDNGDQVEYDKRTNANIEKSYNKKENSLIFFLNDDEKYEIVFTKMQETNLKTNEEIKVIRKDLKADVSVPEYWEAQPLDANGKELPVHLVALDPNKPTHKAEHKMVSDHFHQTASKAIQQIERIQNPSLYKLYAVKKQSLDKKQGSNEQFLFHGTNGNNIKEINEKGLNRSYAGNANGAAFGKGVYFARDASMSVSYVKPDTLGKTCMYYTRVAVGQYKFGNPAMMVPPPKGGNDSYDSTVNNEASPTIFVLFHDAQYYPEYLITFA